MKTENQNMGCPQRNSTECEKYVEASSIFRSENGERECSCRAEHLMEEIYEIKNTELHFSRESNFRSQDSLQIIFSLFMANRCQQFFLVCFHPLSRGMHGGRYQTA